MSKPIESVGPKTRVSRKGQLLRRRSDGFVFRVESISRVSQGAHLQCVDAVRIFGWFTFEAIARDFDHAPAMPAGDVDHVLAIFLADDFAITGVS